jgi:F-type H+-transporting ATPase subunit delta
MAKITSTQYAQALLDAVLETNPKDYDIVLDNFVQILSANGDLGKYQEIEAEFSRLEKESKGIKEAQITVAKEMELNAGLLNNLNQIIGSKIEIKQKVDQGIIGGVIVRVDETLIDASIKTQLNNLNQSLKNS